MIRGKDLNTLDTTKLEELLTRRLEDLQKSSAKKDKAAIKKCKDDIFDLKKLIRLRNL